MEENGDRNKMNLETVKSIPDDKIIVLDTETTGLDHRAEILQFSAVWGNGEVAMNRYIKPSHTVRWDAAMEVNGITPKKVSKCPKMPKVKKEIEELLAKAKVIVGYNLPFDVGMLEQNGVNLPSAKEVEYIDLMVPFAGIYGEWNDYFGDYKWQKLVTCARYYGYAGTNWHDSLADTKATLYCFKRMLQEGDL